MRVRDLTAGYRGGARCCARSTSTVDPGEVVALMGRNGAGQVDPAVHDGRHARAGRRDGSDGRRRPPRARRTCAAQHRRARAAGAARPALRRPRSGASAATPTRPRTPPSGPPRGILVRAGSRHRREPAPRDLSEGQRLALALAVVLAASPPMLLLDEPTRGLDYAAKRRLVDFLHTVRRAGHTVVLATHDVELVAEVATRVVVLADGEVVADGATGGGRAELAAVRAAGRQDPGARAVAHGRPGRRCAGGVV